MKHAVRNAKRVLGLTYRMFNRRTLGCAGVSHSKRAMDISLPGVHLRTPAISVCTHNLEPPVTISRVNGTCLLKISQSPARTCNLVLALNNAFNWATNYFTLLFINFLVCKVKLKYFIYAVEVMFSYG